MKRTYPNLSRVRDPETQETIRLVYDLIYGVRDDVETTQDDLATTTKTVEELVPDVDTLKRPQLFATARGLSPRLFVADVLHQQVLVIDKQSPTQVIFRRLEIGDLKDVVHLTPFVDDDILLYSEAQEQWRAKPIAGAIEHHHLAGLADDDHLHYLKEEASGGLASEVPDHTHRNAAECGQIDHGLALTGLGDDDHGHYLKEEASGGLASEVPDHTHVDVSQCGTVAHGALTGVTSDLHHNLIHTHQNAGEGGKIDHGLALSGLADDDHSRYLDGRNDRCRVYHSVAQAINPATWTALAFDSERFDPNGMHSGASPTRITIATTGTYLVGGSARFATSNTDQTDRYLCISVNGVPGVGTSIARQMGHMSCGATKVLTLSVSTLWEFTAADFVELCAFQNSGGVLNVDAVAAFTPEFWIQRFE